MSQLGPTDLKRLHRDWRRRQGEDPGLSLLLDNVQSPFNVGSIVRTAAALRVEQLWLAGDTAAPDGPKTAKTALGTHRYLAWAVVATALDAIQLAHDDGYRVVGLELAAGAVPLHEADLGSRVCLALGHEDRGLREETLGACDVVAFVPQLGRVGSLNVATAAAIAMYEVRRQGWTRRGADARDFP